MTEIHQMAMDVTHHVKMNVWKMMHDWVRASLVSISNGSSLMRPVVVNLVKNVRMVYLQYTNQTVSVQKATK